MITEEIRAMLAAIIGTGWENQAEYAENSAESVALVSIEPAEVAEISAALDRKIVPGHWTVVDDVNGISVLTHSSHLFAESRYRSEKFAMMRRDGQDV